LVDTPDTVTRVAPLKRTALTVLGWVLVLAGIAALVLPGPGLLLLFVGLLVLSQEYEWAERRVDPVKHAAFRAASDGVQTWPRVAVSCVGILGLFWCGALWLRQPPPPGWWPVDDRWWLVGGWPAGVTLLGSGVIALGLLVYSIRRFRREPYDARNGSRDDAA
jgi:uncharacterized protein (TIGR02611 family)